MKVIKLRANKHSDVLLIGDRENVSTVTIATRMKTTDHGGMFLRLVEAMAPEAAKVLDREIREGIHPSPQYASRNVAAGIVQFCEDITMAALDTLHRNKALGVPLPSYDALLGKLREGDMGQGAVSGDVISLRERQEKEP